MLDITQTQNLGQSEKLEYARILLDIISADKRFDPEEIQKIYMIFSVTNTSKNDRRELLTNYIKKGRESTQTNIPPRLENHETAKFLIAKDIMSLEKKCQHKPYACCRTKILIATQVNR